MMSSSHTLRASQRLAMEDLKLLCLASMASDNMRATASICTLIFVRIRREAGVPAPVEPEGLDAVASTTAPYVPLYCAALASGDPAAVHGVSALVALQARRELGLPVPGSPLELAKFVTDTAPPEAEAAFKDQKDAIKEFEAGTISFAQFRARVS